MPVINTTPSTRMQRIIVSQNAVLQLPEGQDPKVYYAEQLKNANSAFYRAVHSMAQASLEGTLVNIVAPSLAVGRNIAIAIESMAQAMTPPKIKPAPKTPASAVMALAAPAAQYTVNTPATPSSDIPVPEPPNRQRYVASAPFQGEGENLGRGFFAEKVETGWNIWYAGTLAPLAKVPDLETAKTFVEVTGSYAKGHKQDGHTVLDPVYLEVVDATMNALATAGLKPS